MNIFKALNDRGYNTVPEEMYSFIDLWDSWYRGKVAKFHTYKVYNGMTKVNVQRYSAGMGKKVAEDWGNLLMNEKTFITLEGEKEQAFFDEVCDKNNFWVKMNEMQELKSAKGTTAYVPRVRNVTVNEAGEVMGGGDVEIALDYVTAPYIFPLSWENGVVKECAFGTEKTNGKDKYLYVAIHRLNEQGNYDIENVVYKNNKGSLSEVPLASVEGYENVPEVVHTNSPHRQFVIDRLNIANNIDNSLPMGISVFANAIDQIKGVDIAYDSYINEFVLGKKRIIVKPEASKTIDGEPVFDTNDLAFYVLPEDGTSGSIVDEIDMTLRTEEHNAGMQDMLNMLSSKCGFGENHYKFDNGNISTATQVISENSSMFRTIKKHEIILEQVLIELVRIILRLGNTYMNAGLDEDVEISVDFDDSIIEDKDTDFNRDARMVSMGIMNAYEFRAKWLNEDEETAKANLPAMEALVSNEA